MLLALNVLSAESWIRTVGLIGLIAIIFAESGLLVGFFLPGDSLLFLAGAISAARGADAPDVSRSTSVLLIGVFLAAVAGDQVGYAIGEEGRAGASSTRPTPRFFKQDYVDKAEEFFDRHGPAGDHPRPGSSPSCGPSPRSWPVCPA